MIYSGRQSVARKLARKGERRLLLEEADQAAVQAGQSSPSDPRPDHFSTFKVFILPPL